ncbi:hypothetical protein [Streptomyces sp. NPDC002690]
MRSKPPSKEFDSSGVASRSDSGSLRLLVTVSLDSLPMTYQRWFR